MKRSSLKRVTPLRAKPKKSAPDPARDEFKRVRDGICRVCGKHGLVRRHHVVTEQEIVRNGGDPWDLRWGMWVGVGAEMGVLQTCRCHGEHHAAMRNGQPWRIPFDLICPSAIEAAAELLGAARAGAYFDRFYGPAGEWRQVA